MEGKRKIQEDLNKKQKDNIEKDLQWSGLNEVDTKDRVQWKNLLEVGTWAATPFQKDHSGKVFQANQANFPAYSLSCFQRPSQ